MATPATSAGIQEILTNSVAVSNPATAKNSTLTPSNLAEDPLKHAFQYQEPVQYSR